LTSSLLLLLVINAALIVIMLPRIYWDWLRFNHYCQEQKHEKLYDLLQDENQWVKRHMFGAFAAFIMVVAIKRYPYLRGYEQLSDATVAYAMISLMFAFAESLFVQRISNVSVSDD
jgi:hypothetical protein